MIESRRSFEFDLTRPMPERLGPFFQDAETLTIFRLHGAFTLDLGQRLVGYRMDGSLTLLNQSMADGTLEYYPGSHASLHLRNLFIPTPYSGLCVTAEEALAEVDLRNHRLRLGGGMAVSPRGRLKCPAFEASPALSYLRRRMLQLAWDGFDLPDPVRVHGQVVFDLDDHIFCSDLRRGGFGGTSIVQAVYQAGTFSMDAPIRYRVDNVDLTKPIATTGRMAWALRNVERTPRGYRRQAWRCWDGDEGPLAGSVLTRVQDLSVDLNHLDDLAAVR